MQDIIDKIIALEWEDFQKVNSADGRAFCQDDRIGFEMNRKSQFLAWSPEALSSYLNDLETAKKQNRNLLMEKYARMMAWTHPEEYLRIKQRLPEVRRDAFTLVDKIVQAQLVWQEEFAAAYPRLASRGRPAKQGQSACQAVTSFEAYLRGELLTYSVPTLLLYANHVDYLKKHGKNMSMQSVEHLVHLNGYTSLEQAEAKQEHFTL